MVRGKPRIVDQSGQSLQDWRQRIAHEAQVKRPEDWISDSESAYVVDIYFTLDRPSSVPEWKRLAPTVKPDIDKTARAVLDALTGILWVDDCQVTDMRIVKQYVVEGTGQRTGAEIYVVRLDNTAPKPKKVKA